MSVYSSNSPFEKFCSRDVGSLYLVVGSNNFLQAERYVTCLMAFFIPLPLSHFPNFTLLPPLRYSLKITNYGIREKKIFCIYGCYHVISKKVENCVCMYKQPILKK